MHPRRQAWYEVLCVCARVRVCRRACKGGGEGEGYGLEGVAATGGKHDAVKSHLLPDGDGRGELCPDVCVAASRASWRAWAWAWGREGGKPEVGTGRDRDRNLVVYNRRAGPFSGGQE